jgi:hypothetical protein
MMSTFVRNPDVVTREKSDDGVLLFNPDNSDIKVLNETGMFIWNLCDGSRSIEDIVEAFKAEFDEVPDDVEDQVRTFVDMLQQSLFLGLAH